MQTRGAKTNANYTTETEVIEVEIKADSSYMQNHTLRLLFAYLPIALP
jgi:hypothetical protein